MSDGPKIEFGEYADDDLPEALWIQILCFLRIVWPDGFTGPNRFRRQITEPDLRPHHLLFVADDQLISHLEIVTATVTVGQTAYVVQSPTSVMTYPAFRGEGWSSRLNTLAAERIDAGDADIGVLMCAPELINFYSRFGWTYQPDATIVAGPDGDSWASEDVLLTRTVSSRSAAFVDALAKAPLRTDREW